MYPGLDISRYHFYKTDHLRLGDGLGLGLGVGLGIGRLGGLSGRPKPGPPCPGRLGRFGRLISMST